MLLDMNGICKDYMQGKNPVRVLTDVSLQVEAGDYLAIMGPSGSGKTTLMNLIGCLDVPTQGTYLLNGEDIGSLNANKLAEVRNETLGFVFQSFYLLPKMSALDNVALPLLYAGVPKRERRARAKAALERMGLEDRIHFRPNQLSGGQCQRVAIARAIVTNPKLLLADEPTGALDSASGAQIMDIFDELNRNGVTIIMITHEQEVAARAKRICHIRDGILGGGMPGYEVGGAYRKATFQEPPAVQPAAESSTTSQVLPETSAEALPEAPSETLSEMPTELLPEMSAEAPKGAMEQWIENFIDNVEEAPAEQSAERLVEEITSNLFDTQNLPKEIVGTTIVSGIEQEELPGHDTDLFDGASDVFSSPEPSDVFASPEVRDVFSQNDGEESGAYV